MQQNRPLQGLCQGPHNARHVHRARLQVHDCIDLHNGVPGRQGISMLVLAWYRLYSLYLSALMRSVSQQLPWNSNVSAKGPAIVTLSQQPLDADTPNK